MPIYAYRCTTCGHAKDVLQKMSDPVLTVCPDCGASTFAKQLTAAGFQLKGSGWYVTDFRGGNTPPPKVAEGTEAAAPGADKAVPDKPGDKAADKAGDAATAKAAEKAAPTPASAPAAAPPGAGGGT